MAIYFKMLSASGSLIAIPLDQLSGRLKKYDVKCEKNPDLFGLNKPGFFLSGIDGDLTVCLGAGQVCEQFRAGAFPHSVLAAIKKEFNVEIVPDYDHRYWGCTSKEELAANVRKTGGRIQLLKAARAALDETATSLDRKSISSRVSRTLDIVGDRIEDELEECRAFMLGVPHAPLK
jgi:hypothetical protein